MNLFEKRKHIVESYLLSSELYNSTFKELAAKMQFKIENRQLNATNNLSRLFFIEEETCNIYKSVKEH